MARKTKQQKQEDALINTLISQRMSFLAAQVSVLKLHVIAKAAEDSMAGTVGAPLPDRLLAAQVAIDAAIAAVREN